MPLNRQQQIEEQMLAPQHLKTLQDCVRLVNTTNNPDVYFPRYDLLIEKAVALASMKTISFEGDSPKQILNHVFEQKDKNCSNFIERYFQVVRNRIFNLKREEAKLFQVERFHSSLLKYYNKMSEENIRECENKYFYLLNEINNKYHNDFQNTDFNYTAKTPIALNEDTYKEIITDSSILCLHCGTENPEGANFCQNCASNLNIPETTPQFQYSKPKKHNIIKIVLYTLALIIVSPFTLLSLILFIGGCAEKITAMAVCGFILLVILIMFDTFLIKGIYSDTKSKNTLQYSNSVNTVSPIVKNEQRFNSNIPHYDGSIYNNVTDNIDYNKASTIVSIFTNKWREICKKDFVVLDFETTGLSYVDDKIIEIAAIRYENGVETNKFVCLVNPLMPIPAEATQVNNITNHMVADAPPERYLIPKLIKFLSNSLIVAHNANFDLHFLEAAAQRYGYKVKYNYIDTISVSKKLFPGLPNYKLTTIASYLGYTTSDMHRAEADVRVCAEIIKIALDSTE